MLPTNTALRQHRLEVLLTEYRELSADNRARVDLQQRNANVAVVLMTALTSYLVSYWRSHGLDHGRSSLFLSAIILLIVIGPLFAYIFIWRHIDHDENIKDKAFYMYATIRPAVNAECESRGLMSFEQDLRARREERLSELTPLVALGNEHFPLLLFSGAYLLLAWCLRLGVPHYAGGAHNWFDGLLYVASALFWATIGMVARSAHGYLDIAPSEPQSSDRSPSRLRRVAQALRLTRP
jgi:hypothetical protein